VLHISEKGVNFGSMPIFRQLGLLLGKGRRDASNLQHAEDTLGMWWSQVCFCAQG
jgi:hypothetical protein